MDAFSEIGSRLKAGSAPIAVIGLGYVGLPLALALSRHFRVIGFDKNPARVNALCGGVDTTGECDPLADAGSIEYTADPSRLKEAPLCIIAVPTPTDADRKPDLGPMRSAMETIGAQMTPPAVVVVESTVYPGATEELSRAIIEGNHGRRRGVDFKLGYSPERVNPGDKGKNVRSVIKVVAGEDAGTLALLQEVYGKLTKTFPVKSIMIAEAAKITENVQRNVNIALMNELAVIFERMGLETADVLEAAATKWNFVKYQPGLVGGHCIDVDPYYLSHRAMELGYTPQVILSGRDVNDSVGGFLADKALRLLGAGGARGTAVTVLGIAYKENVRDIRNTRVMDLVRAFNARGASVAVCDPVVDAAEVKRDLGVVLTAENDLPPADIVVLAVPHTCFLPGGEERFLSLAKRHVRPVFIDVKSALPPSAFSRFAYWRM